MDWPTELGTICFIRRNGKTLFLYRDGGQGKDIHNGLYVPPGGHFKRGETGLYCVRREVREETGLIIKSPSLRQTIMFWNQDRVLGGMKNASDWYVEAYEATNFEGEVRPEKKGKKFAWVNDEDVLRIGLSRYGNKNKFYECDRKLFDLLSNPGVYSVLVKHQGKRLDIFDVTRVA